jgi:predicted ATPase
MVKITTPDPPPADQPPLWIQAVTLERFKASFKPGRIELSPFTVLIGRNGSGKSTLIEALQWLDTTLRMHAVEACRRYFGIHDLINLRSGTRPLYFKIGLEWHAEPEPRVYEVKVVEDDDERTPVITEERLVEGTGPKPRTILTGPESSDRLALMHATDPEAETYLEFWRRAVFLRLSPNRLAEGSIPRRATSDPLLDEEGQRLPALLMELSDEQRARLVERVQSFLPDMVDVKVSEPSDRRSERVHYSLFEQMPYRGRAGRSRFEIPAWMLSEGTRRLTAILALLEREPRPSLLCIEEVENGLDPWSVTRLLDLLQSAADEGVQVILSTHSPWLLDHVPLPSIIQVRRIEGDTRYQRFMDRAEIQAYAAQVPAGTRYVQEPA